MCVLLGYFCCHELILFSKFTWKVFLFIKNTDIHTQFPHKCIRYLSLFSFFMFKALKNCIFTCVIHSQCAHCSFFSLPDSNIFLLFLLISLFFCYLKLLKIAFKKCNSIWYICFDSILRVLSSNCEGTKFLKNWLLYHFPF